MGGPLSNPKILSPEDAERLLPEVCYLILCGSAQPLFPLGSRSRPSSIVVVSAINTQSSLLPMCINWKQWRSAIVPVLEDPRWNVRNPIVSATLSTEDGLSSYLSLLGKALHQSFISSGWGPV